MQPRHPRRAWPLLAALLLPSCSLLRFARESDCTVSPLFAARMPPWRTSHEITVVTYNIHDLYLWSDHRTERMPPIAKALAARRPDVVCLQEGFVAGDVATIVEALREAGLEHSVDFPSGAVGSGMWIFSRFPIRETYFRKFSRNGAFWDTRGGDWWAGKGVGLARIEVAPGDFLDVYDTHMICGLGPAELAAHRHVQVRELADFVNSATPRNVPALVCGDFNCRPKSREFEYLGDVLHWRLLRTEGWLDHLCGHALGEAYHFTTVAEGNIDGTADLAGGQGKVHWSDHSGQWVRVRIEPAAPPTAGRDSGTGPGTMPPP